MEKKKKKKVKCKHCIGWYQTKHMKKHIQSMHKHACMHCDMRFYALYELEAHVKKHHKPKKREREEGFARLLPRRHPAMKNMRWRDIVEEQLKEKRERDEKKRDIEEHIEYLNLLKEKNMIEEEKYEEEMKIALDKYKRLSALPALRF